MGNSNSLMEKIYIYLPVIMLNSRIDYENPSMVRTLRTVYFVEQIVLFVFYIYFILSIRARNDTREIMVPDVSASQVLMNTVPKSDELKFKRTTYFKHEMTEAFHQLQQTFVALMLTIVVHFIVGIKPILLLQLISTPYNFTDNRLLRKYVLGLKPGYRVWGERFDGEIDAERIDEGSEVPRSEEDTVSVSAEGKVEVDGAQDAAGTVPIVAAKLVERQGENAEEPAEEAEVDVPMPRALEGAPIDARDAADEAEVDLPMPRALEDALIDAWDAADEADWSTVTKEVGPFSVNSQTPVGRWTPLMVACGLPKVTVEQVKYLVSDLEARVDLQDEDGWTCAHWAARHGRVAALQGVTDSIVGLASEPEAGAAAVAELLSVRDNKGKTAADIARDADHSEATLRDLLDILEGVEEETVGDSNVLALD